MANFKVGQRVRIVRLDKSPCDWGIDTPDAVLGMEGVIVGHVPDHAPWEWIVRLVSAYPDAYCASCELAPLTDPRCSEFIADMERFAHLAKPKEHA